MRYLELPQLATLNTILSRIDADDGSKISGRAEAFSAKSAGADRKLWRHVEERYDAHWKNKSSSFHDNLLTSSPPRPNLQPPGPMSFAIVNGMPLKHLYYLIATMNLVFPDYDFSDIDPKCYQKVHNLPQAVQHINNSIQNSGITKSMSVLFEFSRNIWDSIDAAINLDECDIYTFDPKEDDAVDNPFTTESGCMYLIPLEMIKV